MIQPNPTFDFPIADAYLYKKFEWGESITLKLSDWGEKIENFNSFIEDPDFKNIEILYTTPIFQMNIFNKFVLLLMEKKICITQIITTLL